jgi:hypothetical protein
MKATHALITLIVGLAVGIIWLRTFWRNPNSVPASVIAMPIAAAILGLGHWVAYDFAIGHWAGDFSLIQALFNIAVALTLLNRRSERAHIVA